MTRTGHGDPLTPCLPSAKSVYVQLRNSDEGHRDLARVSQSAEYVTRSFRVVQRLSEYSKLYPMRSKTA